MPPEGFTRPAAHTVAPPPPGGRRSRCRQTTAATTVRRSEPSSPGPVSTDLWLGDHGVAATVAGAQGGDAGEVARLQASQAATGRFTTPEEVADLVVLLASERAANVTGSDIVIDGGLVTTL